MAGSAVVIFAKVPKPGRVKTRLLGPLTPAQAAAIHRACLDDTVAHVARVPGCRKWLRVAAGPHEARELAAALKLDRTWQVGVQRGRDLGARLEGAFRSFCRAGYNRVVVVGVDTPWMGTERILSALELLNTADVVLGPTADGGYYLVGARRLVPAMFRNIPWSTAQVLRRTVGALKLARASYRLLPRDFDLDRPKDLARAAALLRENNTRAPALAQVLKKLQGESISRSSRRRAPARRRKTRRLGRA